MGDMRVLKMLEEAGADFDHISRNGESVLTFALTNLNIDLTKIEPVMEYLLAKTNIGEKNTFCIFLCSLF